MKPTTPNDTPQAAEIVSKILADEQTLLTDKRKEYRESLVMPVRISQASFDFALEGFTRDISANGLCLIAPQPFRQGTEVSIGLSTESTQIESPATCCWSAKFGKTYWISGWRLSETLPVSRLLKDDHLVEPEQRAKDRLKTAIPVNINLINYASRIASFTRDLTSDGVSLVSKVATASGQTALLEIMQLDGESNSLESNCLWSKRYGTDHWVSGWDFNV